MESDNNQQDSIVLEMNQKSTEAHRLNESNECWIGAIKNIIERNQIDSNLDNIPHPGIINQHHYTTLSMTPGTNFCASLGKYEIQALALQLTVCHRTEHGRYVPPACHSNDKRNYNEDKEIVDNGSKIESSFTNQGCLDSMDEGTFHMYTNFLRDSVVICNSLKTEFDILRTQGAYAKLNEASLRYGESSKLLDEKLRLSLKRQEEIEKSSVKMEFSVRDSLERQQNLVQVIKEQHNISTSMRMDMETLKRKQRNLINTMSQQHRFVIEQQNLVTETMKVRSL